MDYHNIYYAGVLNISINNFNSIYIISFIFDIMDIKIYYNNNSLDKMIKNKIVINFKNLIYIN